MNKLIVLLFVALSHGVLAGDFSIMSPGTGEITITSGPEKTANRADGYDVPRLTFKIVLGVPDAKTGFSRPQSITLRTGWKRFELSKADLEALGYCSFDIRGVYVGPSRKPEYYYLWFRRLGPRGQVQDVTLEFSKKRQGIRDVKDRPPAGGKTT